MSTVQSLPSNGEYVITKQAGVIWAYKTYAWGINDAGQIANAKVLHAVEVSRDDIIATAWPGGFAVNETRKTYFAISEFVNDLTPKAPVADVFYDDQFWNLLWQMTGLKPPGGIIYEDFMATKPSD